MAKVEPAERVYWFSETFKLSGGLWWDKALRKCDGLALRRRRRLARLYRWPFFRLATDWRLDRIYGGGFLPDPLATFRDGEAAARLFDEICRIAEIALAEWRAEAATLPPLEPDLDVEARG